PIVEDLVDELLCICNRLSGNSFMPRLQTAFGVASAFESWSLHEHHAVYYMLTPLKPPRGHTFHLEVGT
ncbi:IPIL1 protein, partial [Stercorarius parasiticus]|nr:IPIL1 protein [Stercorarius parasiticus]